MKTIARLIALSSLTALSLVAGNGVGIAATATVTIDSTLQPKTVTIQPGTTVTWVNHDSDRHRMRSRTGPVEFDSNDIEPGGSYSFTFTTAGTYPYVDERDDENAAYHGTIVVSGESGGGTGGGGTGGGGTGGGGGTPAPTTASIRMVDRTFTPATVTIATGGTVTWSNDDDTPHTVNASAGGFASGTMNTGQKYSRKFTSAGTFNYFCAFHNDMSGSVRVQTASGAVPPPKPSAGTTGGTGSSAAAGAAAAAKATTPGQSAVSIVDFAFTPPTVRLQAGDAVVWTNRGQAPHTVTAKDGSFDAGILEPGESFRRVFDDEGTFAYVCSLHPNMTGTVLVGARAASASPAATTAPAQPSATGSPGVTDTAASGVRSSAGAPRLGPAAVVGIVVGLPAVFLLGMTMLLRRGDGARGA